MHHDESVMHVRKEVVVREENDIIAGAMLRKQTLVMPGPHDPPVAGPE